MQASKDSIVPTSDGQSILCGPDSFVALGGISHLMCARRRVEGVNLCVKINLRISY